MRASYSSRAFSISGVWVVLVSASIFIPLGRVSAQAGDYTADLPSVDSVKAEIKGSNPTDTLARQGAVLDYLQHYVERIKYNRDVRGPYTPGEQKAVTAYAQAAYRLNQDYIKSHTADEAKAFDTLEFRYELDSAFYKDWSSRLIGPQSSAAYSNAQAGLAASAQRQNQRLTQPANQNSGSGQSGHSSIGIFGDIADSMNKPAEITPAERRCLELGGTVKQCESEDMLNGVATLITGADPNASDVPSSNAIIISGNYHNPATLANITFGTQAVISSCGRLADQGFNYTMVHNGATIDIAIDLEPAPIHLSLRPDGTMAGPGPVTIKGQVISGYMVSERTGDRIPQYSPAIDKCNIATLNPPPPPKPVAPSQPAPQGGLLGLFNDIMPEFDNTSTPPGIRLVGGYKASGGLQLTFAPAFVVLDCGRAHVRAPYMIENTPTQFVIHVQNPGGPFNVAMIQANTLRGAGSTTVNGRLFTGANTNDLTFTPHSESCNVATFSAMGTVANTESAGPDAAPPPSPAPAAAQPPAASAPVGPASLASTMAAATQPAPGASTRAALRVLISSNFNGANPLAGQAVYVMRERMDSVLRKLGVPVPANATPGQAMTAFSDTCRTKDCSSVFNGLNTYYVTAASLDGSGKATLAATAATGQYYFFAIARTAQGMSYVWDIAQNLAPGDNNITLTATNAEVLKQ
jgi:hypothetical protein